MMGLVLQEFQSPEAQSDVLRNMSVASGFSVAVLVQRADLAFCVRGPVVAADERLDGVVATARSNAVAVVVVSAVSVSVEAVVVTRERAVVAVARTVVVGVGMKAVMERGQLLVWALLRSCSFVA